MQADRCRNRTLKRGREFRPWQARCLSLPSKDAQPRPGEKPGKMADKGGLFLIVIPAGGQMVALSVLLPRKA